MAWVNDHRRMAGVRHDDHRWMHRSVDVPGIGMWPRPMVGWPSPFWGSPMLGFATTLPIGVTGASRLFGRQNYLAWACAQLARQPQLSSLQGLAQCHEHQAESQQGYKPFHVSALPKLKVLPHGWIFWPSALFYSVGNSFGRSCLFGDSPHRLYLVRELLISPGNLPPCDGNLEQILCQNC
jgi:hypothetical protein